MMQQYLDVNTLLLMGSIATLAIGASVFIASSRRGFAELWTWNAANLSMLAALLLAPARPLLPEALFVALDGGLGLLGLAFYAAAGASLLSGTSHVRERLLAILAAAALLAALTLFVEASWPRNLLFSVAATILCVREGLAIAALARRARMRGGPGAIVAMFWLGALLFALQAALGALGARRGEVSAFLDAPGELDLFAAVALVVGMNFGLLVVLMSRLEREMTGKVFELGESRNNLQILYDAFAGTVGSVDLEELIPRILELLQRRLSVDVAALYLREGGGEALALIAQRGFDANSIAALLGPQRGDSGAWKSFIERRASSRRIEDYPEGPVKQALCNIGLRVIGCFPIAARGESLGALTIGYKDQTRLDEARTALLETLTLQLGAVVKAATLHDALNQANMRLDALASTDALTGLANRRTALRVLEREAARARRGSGRIAVIMCDIDHFKLFNDEHGHVCGDAVLANTAATISQSVRSTDLAARWGGEEFLIIPGSSERSGLVALAERIRSQVEAAVCEFSGQHLSVTLTLGVSICEASVKAETAIALADEALYEGKRGGRNRVVVHERESGPLPSQDEEEIELLQPAEEQEEAGSIDAKLP
jgi:diguanylate cyclase (GGDEF)-like protein